MEATWKHQHPYGYHQSTTGVFDETTNGTTHDNTFPLHFQIKPSIDPQNLVAQHLAQAPPSPAVSLETNKYRKHHNEEENEAFRQKLIHELSGAWDDPRTTSAFLKLVEVLKTEGCAVFAGLIDKARFTTLIGDYTQAMATSGSEAFLHSFLNLSQHPSFLKNKIYNDAFIHPLLVALIAYTMGGAIRMTDVRGKDTQPISVNAQDNMLHIDNTPFRHEFKVLVGWKKGVPRGPTGQNFTYIPGTHLGNRRIRLDEVGRPWSTENDSVFLTETSLENVFGFQKRVYNQSPCVVEVQYPDQPITVAFSAGSLVHHRYRTKYGSARSCIIAAFHLISDSPGSLLPVQEGDAGRQSSIFDMILGRWENNSNSEFVAVLAREASVIQKKILEISSHGHMSKLLDASRLTLSGEAFGRWKQTVISAPSTTSVKFDRGCFLTSDQNRMEKSCLLNRLTNVMSYDKHGLLDLKLYQDGREEIRKPARKHIFCLTRDTIYNRLEKWFLDVVGYEFTPLDIMRPSVLKNCAVLVAGHLQEAAEQYPYQISEPRDELRSFSQLLTDLGESITRCDAVETYISTSLFIFWAIDQTLAYLDRKIYLDARTAGVLSLRSYISTTLLVEQA
ncbi:hypothetical protein CBS147311_9397 [Penicillium roqueforti]|nr:hypothetical protein CBS147311_9397 [Penicillium roqueforti]